MISKNFISLYEESFRKYWEHPALSNYEGATYTYQSLAHQIAQWHITFKELSLEPQDKIAIMAKDTAEWCIAFLASITYGAVIVPVLQDFAPADAMSIIDHSEAKLLYINHDLWQQFDPAAIPQVRSVIDLQTAEPLYDRRGIEPLRGALQARLGLRFSDFSREDVRYYHTPNSELLLLNYTSGTTGYSKGVMVSANNMAGNVSFCMGKGIVSPHERLLCFLPLAHTYSCMINIQLALAQGVHVILLGKAPTPTILRRALADIKPRIVVSVPLIIEKIYHNAIAPIISTPKVRLMLSIPLVRNLVYRKIKTRLIEGLGGAADEIIVGGAALNPEIGRFLKRIGFPITVGYGMTECAPLISYCPPREWRLGSCGQVLEGFMQARIAPLEGEHDMSQSKSYSKGHALPVGEIQVRGENVCLGYYKNEEHTQALFTEDGWLRTGDLGSMDADNFLYIKGRSKAMLLSGNGQNIYPEEIESKISMIPYVLESLVVMRRGRLEAIIVPNTQAIASAGIGEEEAWEVIADHRAMLNDQLGSYEKVQRFERRDEPFEKTPKMSIKRFLYK